MTERRSIFHGLWTTSLGTLGSRVLGLVRDIATASLLGLGEGGIMDALVLAFRIPNSFRRLLGEGALATSYLPVLVRELENNRLAAWRFVSVMLTWLTVILAAIVLVGEGALALWHVAAGGAPDTALLVGLSAVLLPYLLFICLAAQLTATLQAVDRFTAPAISGLIFNATWLGGVWLVAPWCSSDKVTQAYVLAICITLAGFLQCAVQGPSLWAAGFRFHYDWRASREALLDVGRAFTPVAFALAVSQINSVASSLIAWLLTSREPHQQIAWLGGQLEYPLETGAVAALYYAERFYQFPVGVFGVAIATVIYPLLSRHAARQNHQQLATDLTWGLRITFFTTFPAGMGLIQVAEPLTRVFFEHGEFTAADTQRTAMTIMAFSLGIWAYCTSPVLVRGFYALADRGTPATVGFLTVVLNFVLTLTLVWFLAEAGIALATSIAGIVQTFILAVYLSRQHCRLDGLALSNCLIRSAGACGVMTLVVQGLRYLTPPGLSRSGEAAWLAVAIGAGIAAYLAAASLLKMDELKLLMHRRARPA